MENKKIGIYLYNRLFDPLIQSNFWLYVTELIEYGDYEFYLISYENSKFPMSKDQQALVDYWKSKGFKWKSLNWSPGTSVKSKLTDVIQGFFAVSGLRFKGYKHFVSLASVAASFLYIFQVILRYKTYLYQFEPHSEYAIDNGMWRKESLQYKISHFLERKAAEKASVISSGTKFMAFRLKEEWQVKAHFFKIPSVVNSSKFEFSMASRTKVRAALGIDEKTKLLFYPGKFGDLYYREEVAFMFKYLHEHDENFHFLIVTPHSDQEIKEIFDSASVSPNDYSIRHSDYNEIHHYYSAADFAVIAVPPGPSKKFISNIKVGEYLTAGLPFLITEGVSEDYIYAREKGVGVVVKDFSKSEVKESIDKIMAYFETDRDILRAHCRAVGIEYRGLENLNPIFKEALKSLAS